MLILLMLFQSNTFIGCPIHSEKYTDINLRGLSLLELFLLKRLCKINFFLLFT